MTYEEIKTFALEIASDIGLTDIDGLVLLALRKCKNSNNLKKCIEDFLRDRKAEQENKKKLQEESIFFKQEDDEHGGISRLKP